MSTETAWVATRIKRDQIDKYPSAAGTTSRRQGLG